MTNLQFMALIFAIGLVLLLSALLFLTWRGNERLRRAMTDMAHSVAKIDQMLDDPKGDGSGDYAEPPDGNAYNELHELVVDSLRGAGIHVPR